MILQSLAVKCAARGRRTLAILACALLTVSFAPATPRAGFAAPADSSVPPALQPFDQEMRAWSERFRGPRATVAVMREDRLLLARGYGVRRGAQRVALWSLSKSITAACVASLIRERKLRLDEPIGELLAPVYALHGRPADDRLDRVTVAQLLSHRGGAAPRTGDDGFVPGLTNLFRRVPPRAATIAMLMPEVLRLRLAFEPGSRYAYSNVGYLLLGQIIEAATGERYEEACARRVLAQAGVRDAKLDETWGGILQAAGGWSLSGPEYLAFLRLLRARRPDFLSPELRAWLTNPNGKWVDERGGVAYTLGVMLRASTGDISHWGSWRWRQRDAAGGPLSVRQRTTMTLAADGSAWFASFDAIDIADDVEAVRALDAALLRARGAVAAWPDGDLFGSVGIGPVVVPD